MKKVITVPRGTKAVKVITFAFPIREKRCRHRWNSAGTRDALISLGKPSRPDRARFIFSWCEHCGAFKIEDVRDHKITIRYPGGEARKVRV